MILGLEMCLGGQRAARGKAGPFGFHSQPQQKHFPPLHRRERVTMANPLKIRNGLGCYLKSNNNEALVSALCVSFPNSERKSNMAIVDRGSISLLFEENATMQGLGNLAEEKHLFYLWGMF